ETAAALPGLERGARRDAEDLVAALVRFELLLRQAVRAAALGPDATPEQRARRINQVRVAASQLRDRLAEALRDRAFDEEAAAARAYLGLTPDGASPAIEPTPEAPPAVQVRPVGVPHGFLRALPGPGAPADLLWPPAAAPGGLGDESRALVLLGLFAALAPVLAWLSALRDRAARPLAAVALVAGLVACGAWAGPAGLAVGLGFT